MKKKSIYFFAMFSIVFTLVFSGTTITNAAVGSDSLLVANAKEDEATYPIVEQGAQEEASLGVNTAGSDSYPFVYNILIGAVVLGGILFFLRRKPTS